MNKGISLVVYPVKDITAAKALFSQLLGVQPYADAPYYVGYKVGDREIGLDPNGHKQGMTGPVVYFEVDDIKQSLQGLLDSGAQVHQPVRDVGGGMLIASVKDVNDNVIALRQFP